MSTSEIPTKPYLLRALYEWCVDNGYTPHLAVKVDSRTQVPLEYVKNGEITLNIGTTAVHKMQIGNDLVEFSARFGGVARQISVPVANVYALYGRETGHGMTFDVDAPKASVSLPRRRPRRRHRARMCRPIRPPGRLPAAVLHCAGSSRVRSWLSSELTRRRGSAVPSGQSW